MSLNKFKKFFKKEFVDEDEEYEDDKSYKRFKKIVLGLVSFFGLVIVGAGIVLYLVLFGAGSHRVDITISTPEEITAGVPFDVVAAISNRQDVAVSDAKISIDLPQDLIYLGISNGNTATDAIGDIGATSFIKHTFKVVSVGAVNSSQKIILNVSYISGGSSRFKVESSKTISTKNSPVTLETKILGNVIRGSAFELEIKYKNLTSFDFPDVALQINYPDAFSYESSSIPPEVANNYWRLGKLKGGEAGAIKIKGTYTGPGETALEIPATFYAQFSGKDYLIADSKTSATPSPSPVNLTILVNNQENYVARVGDKITITIHYENKSGIALSNVVLKANIDGSMIDVGTLDTNARVDTTNNWMTWDSSNVPQFNLLDAGAVGNMTASVRIKNLYPIRNVGDKNFAVHVSAKLESPTVPYYVSSSKTTSAISENIKIAGLTTITPQLFFRDEGIDSVNAGAFPPQVGMPTEYTVHWIIRNFSTDAKNVKISASLGSGVEFVESILSTTSESPTYDSSSGEIVWNIEKIPATRGVIGNPVEAIFRVHATPKTKNIGQFMEILGESILKATDDFTGLELDARGPGLTTALTDDRTVGADGGRVIQ